MKRICEVEDCPNPHSARGMCMAHYMKWRRHGDPLATDDPTRVRQTKHAPQHFCGWTDCGRAVAAAGNYCKKHRYAATRLGLMPARTCGEPGCDLAMLARNLCGPHYHQYRKLGAWPLSTDGDPDAWDAAALVADARMRDTAARARINQAALILLHPDQVVADVSAPDLLLEALSILEGDTPT